MVEPNAKLSGSTSVACWLVGLVKVSVLSLTSGTVARGNEENGLLEDDPDPHPVAAKTIAATHKPAALRKATLTPNSYPSSEVTRPKLQSAGNAGQCNSGFHAQPLGVDRYVTANMCVCCSNFAT